MWVKICGNTNLEDAQLAAELGADALGFVFAESKRQVTAAQVAAIHRIFPHMSSVSASFTSRDADEIAEYCSRGRTERGIRLHGGLDLELAARLREICSAMRLVSSRRLHWAVGSGQRGSVGCAASTRLRAGRQR